MFGGKPPLCYGSNLPHFTTIICYTNGEYYGSLKCCPNTLFRWNKWGHKTNFR
jgi:hypothetical protein